MPMRLLCIVNGRRCEFCPRKANSVQLGGLFMCACCANDMTAQVKKRQSQQQQCDDDADNVRGLLSTSPKYLMGDVAQERPLQLI